MHLGEGPVRQMFGTFPFPCLAHSGKTRVGYFLPDCTRKHVKLYAIMDSNNFIEGLLQKPLWQMTGEEYCQLTHYALSLSPNTGSSPAPPGQKALGVHALAVELGCSDSTVYALMRTPREEDGSSEGGGILRPAVVSRIGRRIVFDVDTARRLADDYQSSRK